MHSFVGQSSIKELCPPAVEIPCMFKSSASNHSVKNHNPKSNEVEVHQEFYPVKMHQNLTPRQSGKPTVSAISHRKWYRIKGCSGARTSFTSFEKVHTHTLMTFVFFELV